MGLTDPAGEERHQVYTANKLRGGVAYQWGRCTCGALLEDRAAVEAHRKEFEATRKE